MTLAADGAKRDHQAPRLRWGRQADTSRSRFLNGMTVLAIVSYPNLEEADRDWIESVRAKHDPQAPRPGVHFTLVFPAEASPTAVAAEVSAVARS